MPHCHGGMEEPPVAKRSVGSWRQFLVIALAIVGILAAASVAASFRSGSPPQVSVPSGGTVFYNEACSDCATYLRDELLPALSAADVTPVVVKDYITRPAYRQELRGLNDGLGIPFDLQSHLATFVRDARITVFEGHVPASLIREPLSVYASWYAANGGGAREVPVLLPLVLTTGFVDGLNPCAFAVLLFFVSFLYVSRRPRVEVARLGLLYGIAVFLA